jgi:hypothetical protein
MNNDDEGFDITEEEMDAFIDGCEDFYDNGDDVYKELTSTYPPLYFQKIGYDNDD